MKIPTLVTGFCALGLAALMLGCAAQYKKTEGRVAEMPVNCDTADGDIRVLQNEKTNVAQQAAAGVTMVFPIGLVVGLVQGTQGTKWRVTTGEYNKALDTKIAEIKQTCHLT
jgi:hypothetical protein